MRTFVMYVSSVFSAFGSEVCSLRSPGLGWPRRTLQFNKGEGKIYIGIEIARGKFGDPFVFLRSTFKVFLDVIHAGKVPVGLRV